MPFHRLFALLALVGCAAEPAAPDDDEFAEDGKEDAAGAVLCDPLPAASKELCLQIPNNGWRTALKAELTAAYFEPLAQAVHDARGRDAASSNVADNVYPSAENTFAALRFVSPGRVKAVIVGQDPYIGVDQAIGLSFSVAPDVQPVPRSLVNIYRELETDLGVPTPSTGDLTPWADQGVLLLNRVLTVTPGKPASHRGRGWEHVTARAITALVERGGPLVAILWGRDARGLVPHLPGVACIESPHPSPLSAHAGFFGSRPFSRANELLVSQGADPVDWRIP